VACGGSLSSQTDAGYNALHLAVKGGHAAAAEWLLDHELPLLGVTKAGLTAVHVAAVAGHAGLVTLLLTRAAAVPEVRTTLLDTRTKSGKTALHLAAVFGHEDAVLALCGAGANVSARAKAAGGHMPIHDAAAEKRAAVVGHLIGAGADAFAGDDDGYTAVHIAAMYG